MLPVPGFVTLQVPQLLVHVQHQVLATLRKIPERDLASQFPVRRTATAHRVAAGTEWVISSIRRYKHSPGFFNERSPVNTAV